MRSKLRNPLDIASWMEDSSPEDFSKELRKQLEKKKSFDCVPPMVGAAVFATRQLHPNRGAQWWLELAATDAICQPLRPVEGEPAPDPSPEQVSLARTSVHRLLSDLKVKGHADAFVLSGMTETREGAKEDLTYEFLDAVHRGDAENADVFFSALAADMDKDAAGDLLFSSGLEALSGQVDSLSAAVEALGLLQRLGWEWGAQVLRPIVRQQASAGPRSKLYERACSEVADRALLRTARRRSPGAPSLGETDPSGFLDRALEWCGETPEGRMIRAATALEMGVTLEDLAEVISLGATLLYLQEGLRGGLWDADRVTERLEIVHGARSVRRLLYLGTPGQRILSLLLAGAQVGVRDLRLSPESPECGWWLSPASRWSESWEGGRAPRPGNGDGTDAGEVTAGPEAEAAVEWAQALEAGNSNALLPLLVKNLEARIPVGRFLEPHSKLAQSRPVAADVAVCLAHLFDEAYHATRAPHRWIHLWAGGLSHCLWPAQAPSANQGLQP